VPTSRKQAKRVEEEKRKRASVILGKKIIFSKKITGQVLICLLSFHGI